MLLKIEHAEDWHAPTRSIRTRDGHFYEDRNSEDEAFTGEVRDSLVEKEYVSTWTIYEGVNDPTIVQKVRYTSTDIWDKLDLPTPFETHGWSASHYHNHTPYESHNQVPEVSWDMGFIYWTDDDGYQHAAAFTGRAYLMTNDGNTIEKL
jgi:hypothetical protein